MKKNTIKILAIVTACLIAFAGVGTAMAYFTDYTKTEGLYKINLSPDTTIDEPQVAAGVKHLVVTNTNETPVYVRAKAFAGDDVTIEYTSENWAEGDGGYVYFNNILEAKAKTDGDNELLVKFTYNGTDVEVGDQYNVIVVYEATPVQYDENGNPYADWNLAVKMN